MGHRSVQQICQELSLIGTKDQTTKSRDFAVHLVQQLQNAGFQALWAGGCVRDQLLGLEPKDYDVATSATPQQVREVFGHRRTLAIGSSFGVITVLGPTGAQPIEVATFRQDASYSDGRRPDFVQFTDARQDALRRDFTINGMFFDPIVGQVLDFVDGQKDLERRQIRAIGDASLRIEEDKLRMLRGVRFAARYSFTIDAATIQAIQSRAHEIDVVSNERIGAEMQRMLADSNRTTAVQLLRTSQLLPQVMINADALTDSADRWNAVLRELQALKTNDFCAAATVLITPLQDSVGIETIINHWKLSNRQGKTIQFALKHQTTLANATNLPWSVVQPLLLSEFVQTALSVLEATGGPQTRQSLQFLRQRLASPQAQLDPSPLINGKDLIASGISPGPEFKRLLETCRAKQLDGELTTKQQALSYVAETSGPSKLN